MKLKAKRKTLLDALNSVAVGLSNKSGNPYGVFVLIAATKDSATLTTDSIQLRAEATAKCKVLTSGTVLVHHGKLASLLSRDAEDVELSVEGERLSVVVGGVSGFIPLMAADSFPAARGDEEQKAFIPVDGKSFGYSLALACGCAGDGTQHTWNSGVLIQDDGKNLMLISGDGRQFMRIALPTSDCTFQTVLPAKLTRSAVNAISVAESATLFIHEKSTRIVTESVTLIIQAMDTQYSPDVARACNRITDACTSRIVANRGELLKALQAGCDQLDADDYGLSFNLVKDPQSLVVQARSKSNGEYRESIALKVDQPLPRRRINHTLIIPHLRSLDCEDVALCYTTNKDTPGFRVHDAKCDAINYFTAYMLPLSDE